MLFVTGLLTHTHVKYVFSPIPASAPSVRVSAVIV
jgi:hypothetical protein